MFEKIQLLLKALFQHKLKFVLLVFSALVFLFLLFPFDDLGDLVTVQVSKITNNQVFIQFDRLNLGVTGLNLQNLRLETPSLAPLSAKEITVTPSISSLLQQKPSGSVNVEGLFKGHVEASLKPAGKSENGVEKQKISLSADHLSLSELSDFMELPMALKGQLKVSQLSATTDFGMQEQPDVDIAMSIDKFELPTGNVNTPMGPLTLPEVKLTSVVLKGRLSAGRFQIEDGTVGGEKDELHGNIKGGIAVQMKNAGGSVQPLIGAYDFTFDLSIKKGLQDRAALFLSFLDPYKTQAADGTRFRFRVTGAGPFTPPRLDVAR